MTYTQRIPRFAAAARTPAQEWLVDRIVSGPRGTSVVNEDGSLFGPFNALLLNPRIGDVVQHLGLAAQGMSSLDALVREVVVLRVAALRACELEWGMHESRALAAGLDSLTLERLRDPSPSILDENALPSVVHLVDAIVRGEIDSDTFESAQASFDSSQIFDICILVSYYQLLCNLFDTFKIEG